MEPISHTKRSPLDKKYHAPFKQWLKGHTLGDLKTKTGGLSNPNIFTDISIKSLGQLEENIGIGEGVHGSTTISGSTKFPLYSKYKSGSGEDRLSILGSLSHKDVSGKGTKSETFLGSKDYATSGASSHLFTQSEKDVFKSTLSTRPDVTKASIGVDWESVRGSLKSDIKFSASGGVTASLFSKYLKGEDAGLTKIRRGFDATSRFNPRPDGSYEAVGTYSNTFGRGGEEVFTGGTANTMGGYSTGGVWGTTPSGEHIFTGQTDPNQPFVGEAYRDIVKKHGTGETIEETGARVYTEKQKELKIKPYIQAAVSRDWRFLSNPQIKGTIGAAYGTKHAPDAGFKIFGGIKGSEYSPKWLKDLQLGFEVGTKGYGFSISKHIGRK